jgi:hypothetical protein
VLYALTSQGQNGAGASVSVTNSRFANNEGIGDAVANAASALLSSFGNNAGRPSLSVTRSDFDGNQGFVAEISGQFGGDFSISQSCFTNSNVDVAVYSDGSGTTSADAATNFVDPSFTITGPECTTAESGRILVETFQGQLGPCLEGGTNCIATCRPLASSSVCLSQVELTSLAPSMEPSLSNQPSGLNEPSLSLQPSVSQLPSGEGQGSLVPSISLTPNALQPSTSIEPSSLPSLMPSGDSMNGPSVSMLPSLSPSSEEERSDPPSLLPTAMAQFEPSISNSPSTSEAVISSNPTGLFDSIPPTLSLQPSLSLSPVMPTKAPTFRKDCYYRSSDSRKGKGKGGKGSKMARDDGCRKKKQKKKMKRETLFGKKDKKDSSSKSKVRQCVNFSLPSSQLSDSKVFTQWFMLFLTFDLISLSLTHTCSKIEKLQKKLEKKDSKSTKDTKSSSSPSRDINKGSSKGASTNQNKQRNSYTSNIQQWGFQGGH